jgi:uncharacterized protein (TIGR02118 family)
VISLHAFLVRKPGMSHEDFVTYWRDVHGPFIRDTPGLARHLLRYEQHPRIPGRQGGDSDYDGVAIQSFASWEEFGAMLADPAAEAMRQDEANFLDSDKLLVLFTEEPNVVVPLHLPEGGG